MLDLSAQSTAADVIQLLHTMSMALRHALLISKLADFAEAFVQHYRCLNLVRTAQRSHLSSCCSCLRPSAHAHVSLVCTALHLLCVWS